MLRTQSPFSLILFGASGHLARLKLYPALYTLALKKRLSGPYAIVGFSRSDLTDASFRALVEEAVRNDFPEVNPATLREFLSHVSYHRGQYTEEKDFDALRQRLSLLERGFGNPIRLAYLSIPPTAFSAVLGNLCRGKVHDHARAGDFRCIVEKPVGHDLRNAEEIWGQLTSCFRPEEIFLLDHYLGKEAVRNIYYLRFANPILERLLKNTLIHHVEITAFEDGGIEGRAGYFDHVGTFRDMFQSHLLEIASLLTMRLREEEDAFQDSRRSALEQFYIPPATNLSDVILQGQYNGYSAEAGVAPHSRTNTFIALKLMTRISRWEGIPFYLRSGKRCAHKETRISIQFQETQSVKSGTPNRLDIILQGEAGMRIHLQTKLGGTAPAFRPLILEDPLVCVGDCLPEHGLLLLEAIAGKKQWYLSFEEVRAAWQLVDPLQVYLQKKSTPLPLYAPGYAGPPEADAWIRRNSLQWFP
ncbi:glucose-6-phosphate dehydrogenase (NADP(+)) [Candidatus Peregrinibacteria bacterium]|nr:glucose-6-phosphate dehydrogenase (NADP(+)) [Candidatus Peregrinibacteria bacterium]